MTSIKTFTAVAAAALALAAADVASAQTPYNATPYSPQSQEPTQGGEVLQAILGALFGQGQTTIDSEWSRGRRPLYDQRAAFETRLDAGVRDRTLTRRQAERLRADYAELVEMETRYASDRRFTTAERSDLTNRYNNLTRRLDNLEDDENDGGGYGRWEPLAGQRVVAGLHAVVDALHQLIALTGFGHKAVDVAVLQFALVQARLVGTLRGQQAHAMHLVQRQVCSDLLHTMQHHQLRKALLQQAMPGMGRVAGDGHHARAQGRQAARGLQHRVCRLVGPGAGVVQGRRAVGNGHLRQPMLRISLVVHRDAQRRHAVGAGLHKQAHKVGTRSRPHAAQNAHHLRGRRVRGGRQHAHAHHSAGLSLWATRLSRSSLLMGRLRFWPRGGTGDMNHLA